MSKHTDSYTDGGYRVRDCGFTTVTERQSPKSEKTDGPTRTEPGSLATLETSKCVRVKKFQDALAIVVRHHGAPTKVVNSLLAQVGEYLNGVPEETFLKRAKYLILSPMAQYLRNEPPAAPDIPFTSKGRWRRWSRERLKKYSNKNTHLWYSFLQAKRGGAEVSKDIVFSNFLKHREAMEALDPLAPVEIIYQTPLPVVNDITLPDPFDVHNKDILLNSLLEGLNPVMRRLSTLLSRDLEAYFVEPGVGFTHSASLKACYEVTRGFGGASSAIRGRVFSDLYPDESIDMAASVRPGLERREGLRVMRHRVGAYLKDEEIVLNPVYETRDYPEELEGIRTLVEERLADVSAGEILEAQCAAVLEPFKVRIISKGPAVPYFLAKPVQEVLHTRMRRMGPFRLIGRPAYATDLADLRDAQRRIGLGPEEMWLSIDYSAATDGLSAILSSEIMSRLLGSLAPLNPPLYELLLSVLAPHEVHYPDIKLTVEELKKYHSADSVINDAYFDLALLNADRKGRVQVRIPPVVQRNGQLMGSPLSFPILCLANLALYLAVRRTTRPRASLRELLRAVLVNGDDMLYIGTKEEWNLHIQLGELMGLRISPGKAYIHKRYANINSMSYECDLSRPGSIPERIGFLNVGLFVGNHKVMSKEEGGIIPVVDRVTEGAWKGLQPLVLSQFLSRHRDAIKREAKGRNLFIPFSAGGLGCTPPFGFKFHYTEEQLKWIAGLRKKYPYLVPSQRPLPEGRELVEVSDRLFDPIREEPDSSRKGRRPPRGEGNARQGALFGLTPYLLSDRV